MTFFFLESLSLFFTAINYRGIQILAYLFGIFIFDILRIRRKIILLNLDLVYGNQLSSKEKRRLGRKSVQNLVCTVFEFFASKRLFPKAKVTFINKPILDEIFARNKGIYAMVTHMGNWEYLCHINSVNYSEIYVVAKEIVSGKAGEWIKNLRRIIGFTLIDRQGSKKATHQIFSAIESKKIIGFIVDQKRPGSEKIPLFGVPASTSSSLAKLYFKKPAPILPVSIKRLKPGHFQVKYYNEFIFEKDPNLSNDENATKFGICMNKQVEEIILECPEEYFWFHNRWQLVAKK